MRKRIQPAAQIASIVALAALFVFVVVVMVWSEFSSPPSVQPLPVRVSASARNAIQAERLLEEARSVRMWHRRPDEAEAKFLEALALDPDNAGAWFSLGELRQREREGPDAKPDADARAAEAFEHALKADPKHARAAAALAAIVFRQRNYDRAEQAWLQAPGTPESAAGLAKVYLLKGNYDEAAQWAQTGLATRPNDSELREVLAAARARTLKDDLRRDLEPPRPVPKLSRDVIEAMSLFARGLRKEAIAAFETVLQKSPDDTLAHTGLGSALLDDGKVTEAKSHFETTLKRYPDSFAAMNGLAHCLKAEGKTEEAIRIWEQLVKPLEATDVGAGTPQLAQIYIELKRYDKAIEMMELWVEANPGNADGRRTPEIARRAAATDSIK